MCVEPLDGISGGFGLRDVCYFKAFDHTEAVPDFVAEVTSLLAEGIIIEDVVSGRRREENTHTHTVCAETLDEVQRVGRVTEGFGHLTSEFVAHDTCEIDVLERHFAYIFIARHDHTCHPEEDDVRSGYQVCRRVVIVDFFVVGVLNAVEQGNRPKPGREPSVERTFVLHVIAFGLGFRNDDLVIRVVLKSGLCQQVGVVICRDAVTPPELAGDTPVFDVLEPVAVCVFVFGGIEDDVVVHYRRECDVCEVLHFHEPLEGQPRLDRYVRTLGVADFIVVVFDFLDEVERLEIFDDGFAAIETIHAVVLAYVGLEFGFNGVHIEMCVRREDVDGLEVVFLTKRVVVDVMRRRHFEATCTETDFHITVFDNRDYTTDTRHDDVLAFEPLILLLFGVDADRNIAENGFRTRGCYYGIFARLFGYFVAQVVELVMLIVVDYFLVGKGCLTLGIPVDHTQSAIDKAFFVKVAEDLDDRLRAGFVHGESGTVPVAGTTEFAELLEDDTSVFVGPVPGMFEELFAGEV